jgi:superfamily II DNA or RNA helicase
LADEALDVPILSRVVLTFPGKHDGRIVQQVGRALREFPDKDDSLIIDVVDDKVRVLGRQAKARESAYRSMRIPIRKEKFQWR